MQLFFFFFFLSRHLTNSVRILLLLQVADLIKRRKCVCQPEIVDTLLVLKLRDADPYMPKGAALNPASADWPKRRLTSSIQLLAHVAFPHGLASSEGHIMSGSLCVQLVQIDCNAGEVQGMYHLSGLHMLLFGMGRHHLKVI